VHVREIKELIRQYHLGIFPRRMGQNFLIDANALNRIATALRPAPGDRMLEIGAGLGALTEALLATGAHVVAVEKDAKFFKVLSERFAGVENLELVHSDILDMELEPLAGEPKSLLVVGNIPYSMTAKILEFLLEHRRWVKRAVLTVQKEVAQRIIAKPGSKVYSSISILVQVAFKPSIAFTLSPGVFYPQPEVTSAVLKLDPLEVPAVAPEEEEGVLRLTRRLFLHRRKTLLNGLALSGLVPPGTDLSRIFKEAGIDPIRRPETLGIPDLARIFRHLPV
jgi:16S rRNA (adenine1518-N6/adenine1519-N6)-dimethyltransferase